MGNQMEWDGVQKLGAPITVKLMNAAQSGNWTNVISILKEVPELTNTRPQDKSYCTVLHYAASGAPLEVVQQLIALGAERTLKNADGDRPVDIAAKAGQNYLLEALQPQYNSSYQSLRITFDTVNKIEKHFHSVIMGRSAKLVEENRLILPQIEHMLEHAPKTTEWFGVPGMYGGFKYWFQIGDYNSNNTNNAVGDSNADTSRDDGLKLVAESWCRVAEGSGQRHVIDAQTVKLAEEGFV